MMRIIHRLKCRFSEPYRIKVGFGLSPLRNNREMKALIEFCREELREDHIQLNLAKMDIYEETIRMYESDDLGLTYYIDDHCGWYWS